MILENIVYNELLYRGYAVNIGKPLEKDFISPDSSIRHHNLVDWLLEK